jgi:hypothetical protein
MATNKPLGDNARKGPVKDRSQLHQRRMERFIKRDKTTGQFLDVKADAKKFKGVVKEK